MKEIISKTFRAISIKPSLIVPFFFVGYINLSLLVLLYFSPRSPISNFFGPPLRKLFGSDALNYPQNFSTLLQVMSHSGLYILGTVGIFSTAYALWMLRSLILGKSFSVLEALKIAFKKYFSMLLVFILVFLSIQLLVKICEKIISIFDFKGIAFFVFLIFVKIMLAVLVQALFFFMFPSMIIGNKKLFVAFKESFSLLRKSYLQTFGLVLLPTLLSFVSIALKVMHVNLVGMYDFEIIVGISLVSIVINVIIDLLVTLFAGIYYSELTGISADQIQKEGQ